jgi:hypothetical protein
MKIRSIVFAARAAAVTLSSLLLCSAACAQARLTILDGGATVIRGATQSAAVVGMLVKDGDIVESAEASTLVRVEFADKSLVDIGPSTRVWVRPTLKAAAGSVASNIYVLGGWIKLVAAPGQGAGAAVESPTAKLLTRGACVFESRGTTASVFAEAGDTRVFSKLSSQTPMASLASGQFLALAEGKEAQTSARPPPAWMQGVPRAFKDLLAPRAERFGTREPVPAPTQAVDYAAIEAWLKAEPAVRKALMPRWKSKASEPAFRKALIDNMRHHPEWDRIVFPEKYLPKLDTPTGEGLLPKQ